MHHHAADNGGPDRVQLVLEGGDDAEVAAAAADGPEEIGMLGRAGVNRVAVREDEIGAEQVVDRHAVTPAEPPEAAAQRESGDAGVTDRASRRCEPERLRGFVEVRPARARFGSRGALHRIDLHGLHLSEVDHDAVVTRRLAGHVVTTAPHGNRHVAVRAPS